MLKYTLVIPYIHRPMVFHRTLASYVGYMKDRDDYEILIMESERNYSNAEYHNTLENIVKSYSSMLNIRIERVFGYTGVTPAVAYNYGVCMSQAEFILFTQPEIKFLSNVLTELDAQFEQTPESFVLLGTKWIAGKVTWKNNARNPEGGNLPFAIAMRKDVYKDCSYDLIYAAGHCYEDANWRNRLRELDKPLVITNKALVAHQRHPKVMLHATHWPIKKLKQWNRDLYFHQHAEVPSYKVPPISVDAED